MAIDLELSELPGFEPFLRHLVDVALSTGEKAIHRKGFTVQDIHTDRKLARDFIRQCHRGYELAQRTVVDKVLEYTELKSAASNALVQSKKSNNHDKANKCSAVIRVLDNRILLMRRLIDTMAMTLVQHRTWVANRFVLHDHIANINVDALHANAREASWKNYRDKMTFNLVTDLTTFINVGDLLKIDFNCKGKEKWEIIELKSGKVNNILQGIIDDEGKEISKDRLNEIAQKISKSAPKQLLRMVRQQTRMEQVESVKTQNLLTDISMGKTIQLTEDVKPISHYDDALRKVINDAKLKGTSIVVVDRCLYIVASRGHISSAAHALYHTINPDINCAFSGDDEAKRKEEVKQIESLPQKVDLIRPGLQAKTGTPIFLYPLSRDAIFDLIFGRVSVLLHLNIEGLKNLCKVMGVDFVLVNRKETDSLLKEHGRYHIPLVGHNTIKIICPSGQEIGIMSGFFRRIIADFERPKKVIELFCSSAKH